MEKKSHTPLQKLLFNKGVNLQWLHHKTGISYPTLVHINRGYRSMPKRDENHKIISKEKKKFTPEIWTLMQIAKALKVKPNEIYEDRSGE